MKKILLIFLSSCANGLKIQYNKGGFSKTIETNNYTKKIKRYSKDDEKVISEIRTDYKSKDKGTCIDSYILSSVSENSIYRRINIKDNTYIKNYHGVNPLNLIKNLKFEIENDKFKKLILAENENDLEDKPDKKYRGKRYEIDNIELKVNSEGNIIVFKNAGEEVIKISYEKVSKNISFLNEEGVEKYFIVKATLENNKKEILGVYYHLYDVKHESSDISKILPFAQKPEDIKMTIVKNRDTTNKEKISLKNSFRILYDNNTEVIKGRNEKIIHEQTLKSADQIENTLRLYTILDRKDFIKSFLNIKYNIE